jgi:hypothetical protein
VFGCLVAADWSALGGVAAVRWSERYDEYPARHLRDHQPIRGRESRIEERVGVPHFVDVLDAERSMLEEVGSLVVYFEWVRVIELSKSNSSSGTE